MAATTRLVHAGAGALGWRRERKLFEHARSCLAGPARRRIAGQLDDTSLQRFGDQQAAKLRQRIADFDGVDHTSLPDSVKAELRPYQKAGFDFLCHLTRLKLGGILADDMGLGKTLQTLSWLA